MHRFRFSGHLAFLLVLALSPLGCASLGIGMPNLVSIEEEWQLGQRTANEIATQVRLSRDATLNRYVSQMGQRIVAQTPMANLPWNFYVIEDDAINAFNIPGGHVYINTGLIRAASSASELAGVMAHEIVHGVSRHGTEQLSRQYGLSVLAGIALGQDPGVVEQIAAQVVAGGASAKFSRGAEREADQDGIRFMTAAGYNPNGMVRLFETLMRENGGGGGGLAFLNSHPLTQDRIRDAQKQINAMRLPSGLVTNDNQFNTVRQRAR